MSGAIKFSPLSTSYPVDVSRLAEEPLCLQTRSHCLGAPAMERLQQRTRLVLACLMAGLLVAGCASGPGSTSADAGSPSTGSQSSSADQGDAAPGDTVPGQPPPG